MNLIHGQKLESSMNDWNPSTLKPFRKLALPASVRWNDYCYDNVKETKSGYLQDHRNITKCEDEYYPISRDNWEQVGEEFFNVPVILRCVKAYSTVCSGQGDATSLGDCSNAAI